ncbi:MAG: hypothetical protein Ct9H300mP1_11540 [Planctomycetaceae bacterium]|nr:MAG: hypothetical protein Ct9H300mP1_11540 [Planctomycetaceae bacterium]
MNASAFITPKTCPGVPVTNQNVAPARPRTGWGFLRAVRNPGRTRHRKNAGDLRNRKFPPGGPKTRVGPRPTRPLRSWPGFRTVDVATPQQRNLVGQQLQRNACHQWLQELRHSGTGNHLVDQARNPFVVRSGNRDHRPPPGLDLLKIADHLLVNAAPWRHEDLGVRSSTRAMGPVLHFRSRGTLRRGCS